MAIKNKYSNIDLSKYDKGYQKSKSVRDAEKQKTKAENLVKNYGDFKYGRQEDYSSAMDSLLNRKKFSYDLNADALYNQYKDQYMTQGKQAMMDTIGQASALTGGYGNSYAATVGNQAYQSYIQEGLNSIVPQLYQLALSGYQAEGDRLAQNFSVLSADRDAAYGMYTDKYNRLVGDRDYFANAYNNAYTQDYSQYVDNRDYDTSQYWNEYNAGYQKDRDAIADAQWQKNYDLSYYQAHKSSGGNSKGALAGIPDYVLEGCERQAANGNDALNSSIIEAVNNGQISREQGNALYAFYQNEELEEESQTKKKSWWDKLVDGLGDKDIMGVFQPR